MSSSGKEIPEGGQPQGEVAKSETKVSRSGSRDKDVKKSRSRSRSRDRRRSRSRDRRRSRSRDRRRRRSYSRSRSRDRKRSRSRSRDRSRKKHKKDKKKKKKKKKKSRSRSRSLSLNSEDGLTREQIDQKHELEALTRDARTVFVSQLQVKVTEKDLKHFFKTVCNVKDIVLIRDRFTNRSKGFGYVEVKTLEDVPKALMLTGQRFVFRDGKQGFPVNVKASEAEKNFTHNMEKKALEQSLTSAQASANDSTYRPSDPSSSSAREDLYFDDRLEISNLHPNIGENEIKELCSAFGAVSRVKLVKDRRGDYGADVDFESAADAKKALEELNGMDLAGMRLRVRKRKKPKEKSAVSEKFGSLREEPRGADDTKYRKDVNMDSQSWRLEDDDAAAGRQGGGGVTMNSHTRTALMSKLAGGVGSDMVAEQQQRTATAIAKNVPKDVGPGRIQGAASRFLVIKNMFNAAEETEADWVDAVREDTEMECGKFGRVMHCAVDEHSAGNVYIMFDSIQAGVDASHSLHGRWFAKRMVQVEYMKRDAYELKYPQVKNLE